MAAIITAATLRKACKGKPDESNLNSMVVSLNIFGKCAGLDNRACLAHFLAQVLHESGSFKYDREVWGPTPAQKKYEGRADLGNTQPGDGSKFRGYGPMQLTGRYNTTKYHKYALQLSTSLKIAPPPDFTKDPSKITTDPWEGLSAIWYWDEGNPTGKSLNRLALDNNITMITRRVNGGLNGFADRLDYYGRAALVLLGYGTSKAEIKRFQEQHPAAGNADGIIGDKTRMALHVALSGTNPYREEVKVKVEKPVAVTTDDLEKPWYQDKEGVKEIVTTIGAPTILSFFTDMSVEKIIAIAAILALSSLAWYWIRNSRKTKQRRMVAEIEEDAE